MNIRERSPLNVAYVVKRYPRYSETFVVNEILAHEAAGLNIRIYSLLPTNDEYFQDVLAKVRSPVKCLNAENLKAIELWNAVCETSRLLPDLWNKLKFAEGDDARSVYQAIRLAGEITAHGIHHVHAHFASSATTVARLAAHFAGVPYSFTAHAKDIFHESVIPEDLRKKLEAASAVVTVSEYNLEYFKQKFDGFSSHVRCIHNGIDLNRFRFSEPNDRASEIVAVGRLVEKKGFADLIDACACLASRNIEFRCNIIGAGELETNLRAQIEHLKLAQKVRMLGAIPQGELVEYVQRAALLVAPCVIGSDGNRDGLPTVLLEAMALGTPCIATDVTGIPEVIHHQVTGLIVPQHDPNNLSIAIEQLLVDCSLRKHLAHNARMLMENRFNVHDTSSELRNLFQLCVQADLSAVEML